MGRSSLSGLTQAVAFLTRIPIAPALPRREDLASAPPWFPVVGGLIGGASALVYWVSFAWMPSLLAAVLATAAGVAITGAFHEDGLADSSDAFGAGATGERAIEIMRDPRLGTYGNVALVLIVSWRIFALAGMPPAAGGAALVASHSLGRAAVVGLMHALAPAGGGTANTMVLGATRPAAVVACASGAGLAAAALGWVAVPAIVGTGIVGWMVGRASSRRLGGVSGDVLGAAEQLSEALVLGLAASWAWTGGVPWWAGMA